MCDFAELQSGAAASGQSRDKRGLCPSLAQLFIMAPSEREK